MRELLAQLIDLVGRAAEDLAFAVHRSWQRRRHERLYGAPSVAWDVPHRRSAEQQFETLVALVKQQCELGQRTADLHARARTKLDATEYALSAMLDELRGVMTTMPARRSAMPEVASVNVPVAGVIPAIAA